MVALVTTNHTKGGGGGGVPYDYLFKFVLIGDAGVGKTCLLLQFTDKRFRDVHDMTIGVEFGWRQFSVGEKRIKLQVWDTAGQDTFRSVTRSYYRGAAAIFLVFDITQRRSFDSLSQWIQEARDQRHSQQQHRPLLILLGNKNDLCDHRQVSREEAEKFAAEQDIAYFETSAKTADNVDRAFFAATAALLDKLRSGAISPRDDYRLTGVRFGSGLDAMKSSELVQVRGGGGGSGGGWSLRGLLSCFCWNTATGMDSASASSISLQTAGAASPLATRRRRAKSGMSPPLSPSSPSSLSKFEKLVTESSPRPSSSSSSFDEIAASPVAILPRSRHSNNSNDSDDVDVAGGSTVPLQEWKRDA